MPNTAFRAFKAQALAEGFDQVLERSWPADTIITTHSHPFDLKAQMVKGEMWLRVGEQRQHLVAGDVFSLDRTVLHDEHYGDTGATYWVARKN